MRTLSMTISDNDYRRFRLKNDKVTFTSIVDLIKRELAVETLDKCVAMSEEFGLSDTTLDEINAEINAIRNDAKERN